MSGRAFGHHDGRERGSDRYQSAGTSSKSLSIRSGRIIHPDSLREQDVGRTRLDEHIMAVMSSDQPSSSEQGKKSSLAISELVTGSTEVPSPTVQPSFVSLSLVEKSPTQQQLNLSQSFPSKRPRLNEPEVLGQERLLPRPVQRGDGPRTQAPLLPAMVTGLHNPPPNPGTLPSMNIDGRLGLTSSPSGSLFHSSTSRMQVKDILQSSTRSSHASRSLEQMLSIPDLTPANLPLQPSSLDPTLVTSPVALDPALALNTSVSSSEVLQPAKNKETRQRRTRRKWSDDETSSLLAGVKKHGFGKWKQILNDPEFMFMERTSIDLKDRFRVFAKDYTDSPSIPGGAEDAEASEAGADTAGGVLANKSRRKRHPWTREEDKSLLEGVQKHGFEWTRIHKDAELGLSHRRATDLRDRIRNKFPDAYKAAETRPFRAEVKQAERVARQSTSSTLETSMGMMPGTGGSTDVPGVVFAESSIGVDSTGSIARQATASGRVPSIANLTGPSREEQEMSLSAFSAPQLRRTRTTGTIEHGSGVTLPSLAISETDGKEEWDNTLPPFVGYEDPAEDEQE